MGGWKKSKRIFFVEITTVLLLESWSALGANARNAFQSQALIQLKTRYCDEKRCLECAIGGAILK
jgi:hypothetical protein